MSDRRISRPQEYSNPAAIAVAAEAASDVVRLLWCLCLSVWWKGEKVSTIAATVTWKGDGLLFEGRTDNGAIDVSGAGDPPGSGPTPSELLIMAAAACTAMDVISILKKMRQPVESFSVHVTGTKAEEHPRRVTAIHVVYHLRGDLSEERVRRAIELSETRYCAVEATLRECVAVTSECVIEAGVED